MPREYIHSVNQYMPPTKGHYIYNKPRGGVDKWWAIQVVSWRLKKQQTKIFYSYEEAKAWLDIQAENLMNSKNGECGEGVPSQLPDERGGGVEGDVPE